MVAESSADCLLLALVKVERPVLYNGILDVLPVCLLTLALMLGRGRHDVDAQEIVDGAVHLEAAHRDACARGVIAVSTLHSELILDSQPHVQ